jgi:hypothetical protein
MVYEVNPKPSTALRTEEVKTLLVRGCQRGRRVELVGHVH